MNCRLCGLARLQVRANGSISRETTDFQNPAMFIQTETTPNPATLKFLPGQPVMTTGTAFFPDRETAFRSALARRLFTVDGVSAVFLGADFITVTKTEASSWDYLKTLLLSAIMEHYLTGLPVIEASPAGDTPDDGETDPLVTQIKELLDSRIRPYVAQDGGDIVFNRFEDGILYLEMHGACAGCPSSTATLKTGIENMLRHYIPEVEEVRAVA
jgi:Fe-S cluster biogenesis protein NfuA